MITSFSKKKNERRDSNLTFKINKKYMQDNYIEPNVDVHFEINFLPQQIPKFFYQLPWIYLTTIDNILMDVYEIR